MARGWPLPSATGADAPTRPEVRFHGLCYTTGRSASCREALVAGRAEVHAGARLVDAKSSHLVARQVRRGAERRSPCAGDTRGSRMGSDVFLSVVLPAYNEAGSIRSTLTAMRSFLDAQGYTYEIIVAADGDDETPDIVREIARDWPAVQLTAEAGRHGKGHGVRRGMRLASGEIVGFIDAD